MGIEDWDLCPKGTPKDTPKEGSSMFEIDETPDPVDQPEHRTFNRRTRTDRREQFRFDKAHPDRRQSAGRRQTDQIWTGGYNL